MSDGWKNVLIIVITLILGYLITLLPFPENFSREAVLMLSIAFIAVVFWITECIPIYITAIVIMFLQGVLGIQPIGDVLGYIASPVNTIVLAGFVIAAAFSTYDLDTRFSLHVISIMGNKTRNLALGAMLSTALLSMWIANTAAAAIMVPIGVGILEIESREKRQDSNLGKVMLIGIGYAAHIGGIGTPAGTTVAPITIAFLEDMAGIHITFLEWMLRGVPVVILLTPLAWFILSFVIYPLKNEKIGGGREVVSNQLQRLGGLKSGQKHVIFLFFVSILLWVADSFLPLLDDWLYIASLIIVFMFLAPVIGVISWEEAEEEIGWGVFILVGGGLALGSGLEKTGIISMVGGFLANILVNSPFILIILAIGLLSAISITLLSSVTATASTVVPIAITLALSFGMDVSQFAMVSAFGASLAFLLPITPPNAISYKHDYFDSYDMTRAGVPAVILAVLVIGAVFGLLHIVSI